MSSLQSGWDWVVQFWGSDFNLHVYGTFFVSLFTYWLVGGMFLFFDFFGPPPFLKRFRVQENVKTYPISGAQLVDLLKVVGFNQLLVLPFAAAKFWWETSRGVVHSNTLPSLPTALAHLTVFAICTEIFFYYSHRLLHHPALYKRIHKKHHTWISPIAFAAAYAHPIEHIFSNVLPISVGSMFVDSHLALLWIYAIYATVETLTVHSGFHLPLLKSPEFHDFHHLKFNYNYGVTGLMDWIHGTDSLFRTSKQGLRDKRLWSWTPVKVAIP